MFQFGPVFQLSQVINQKSNICPAFVWYLQMYQKVIATSSYKETFNTGKKNYGQITFNTQNISIRMAKLVEVVYSICK